MPDKLNNIKNKTPESDLLDIFNSVLECISRVDKQGNYLSVNQQFADACGYQAEEMVGLSWYETVHPNDIEKAKQAYEVMLEKGRVDIELRGIRKNMTTFYKRIVMVEGIEDKTSLLGHYCFMQDITEGKLSEQNESSETILEKHKNNSEKLNNLLSLIPAVSFRADADRENIFEISDNISSLSGYSCQDFYQNIKLNELILEDDFENTIKKIKQAIHNKETYEVSYRIDTKSGEIVSIKEQGIPVVVAGEVKYIDGLISMAELAGKSNHYVKKLTNEFHEKSSDFHFKDVVRKLSEATNAKIAVITECVDFTETSVRTLAFYNRNEYLDSIEYELTGTPCQIVIKGEACFYPEKIQENFPNDSELVELNAESFCGVPLFNNLKEVIGHLYIIDDKPLSDKEKYLSILESFALPVAKELERQLENIVVNELAAALNIIHGERYFNDLAIYIQKILKADYVIIGELNNSDPCEIKTLALCYQGDLIEGICYPLEGSPCQSVLDKRVNSYPEKVLDFYPDNNWLRENQAQSFVGAPLLDSKGKPVGVISVINTSPIKNINTYESLVNIFAIRAADELSRLRYEKVLSSYKNIINSSSDLISTVDLDYKYISVNKSYLKLFDKREEEIIGFPIAKLHGDEKFNN